MIIDLEGVIHSKIKLGPSFVDSNTKELLPVQDVITLNIHRNNGFIRTAPKTNSTGFSLQFNADENREIQQIVDTVNVYPFDTVATMDGYGYILDDYGNRIDWNIKYPTLSNTVADIIVLPNNTQAEFGQIWSLLTTDLRKHEIMVMIIYKSMPQFLILVKFDNAYDTFVELTDDGTGSTVNIKIIDSTFNEPGGRYHVLIDDGFTSSKDYHEPTIVQEDNHRTNIISESSIDGKVTDGTTYFKTFENDKLKREEFFNNLTFELAKAIPVDPERITSNKRNEIDTSVSPEQYILSINIKKAKNKDKRSVNLVAKDLDTLIKNKLITVICSGAYSNYLDQEYEYVTIRKNKSYFFYHFGIDTGPVQNIFTTSIFFATFPFIVNLGFIIIIDELMRADLPKLLLKVDELLTLIKESDLQKESEKVRYPSKDCEKAIDPKKVANDSDRTEDMIIEVANEPVHTEDMIIEINDPDHTKVLKIESDNDSKPIEGLIYNNKHMQISEITKELKKIVENKKNI
ncbi:hypothetical protein RclHR1_00610019 [Rhizophagus clarus]|uniref:Uncharacterized protein n=1 Tax=Rhizophagus clarus TaxID=94130 RepID=A0A2Z6SHG2_9GLOM|nr:hypothetical protein RclHR1_00610019 [Rhizophagus clarus]